MCIFIGLVVDLIKNIIGFYCTNFLIDDNLVVTRHCFVNYLLN